MSSASTPSASFAVTLAVAVFGVTRIDQYLPFAFGGAVVGSAVVYLAASGGRGGPTPLRLTLVGVAFTAVLLGISQTLALIDTETFDRMRFWGAGTITDRPTGTAADVAPFVLAGLLAAAFCARPLNAIALGDDAGRAVGLRVGATRCGVVVAVALLCGSATAAAGPLMFVGLMVPHAVRWLTGPDWRWILAYSAVLAPAIVLLADVLGRIDRDPVRTSGRRHDAAHRRARTDPAGARKPGEGAVSGAFVLRAGSLSLRATRRGVLVCGLLSAGLLALALWAFTLGSYSLSLGDLASVMSGTAGNSVRTVVLEWRAPRIVAAVLFGAALAMGGAVFQSLTRNPLGSPDVIGFTTGSYTGVVLTLLAGASSYSALAAGALAAWARHRPRRVSAGVPAGCAGLPAHHRGDRGRRAAVLGQHVVLGEGRRGHRAEGRGVGQPARSAPSAGPP